MSNGININGDWTGVSINGVRCGLVSEWAVRIARETQVRYRRGTYENSRRDLNTDELRVLSKAWKLLVRMRREGYSPQHTRKAFVQKIVDEANSCRVAQAVEQVAVNDLAEGSSPSSAATDRSKTCADDEKLSSGDEIIRATERNDSSAEPETCGE